jgi:hypothetical protein
MLDCLMRDAGYAARVLKRGRSAPSTPTALFSFPHGNDSDHIPFMFQSYAFFSRATIASFPEANLILFASKCDAPLF